MLLFGFITCGWFGVFWNMPWTARRVLVRVFNFSLSAPSGNSTLIDSIPFGKFFCAYCFVHQSPLLSTKSNEISILKSHYTSIILTF